MKTDKRVEELVSRILAGKPSPLSGLIRIVYTHAEIAALISAELRKVKEECAERFRINLGECIEIAPNKVEGVITGSDIERLCAAILSEED